MNGEGLGGEWTIVDDGLSTNGTYVNGQPCGCATSCGSCLAPLRAVRLNDNVRA
jgi:pSer/pThr/pTyr-binding forkhead associated (FHA) protein